MQDLSRFPVKKPPFTPKPKDMHLRAYLDRSQAEIDLSQAPAAINWYDMPQPDGNLPEWDGDALNNDRHGNCFEAAVAHGQILDSKLAGAPVIITGSDVDNAYRDITGFNPVTEENDDGTIPREGMDFWRTVGMYGDKLPAYLLVNPNDDLEVKWAMWRGVCLLGGFQLPDCAKGQVDSSGNPDWFIPEGGWPAGDCPGKWGGHMIELHGFGNSWGLRTNMTDAWFRGCCDELYLPITRRMQLRSGLTPCGLAFDDVLADAQARGAG